MLTLLRSAAVSSSAVRRKIDMLPIIWAVAPAAAIMVAGASLPVPLSELTRDPAALVLELKSWAPNYGLIANIGIALWFVAVGVLAVALLTASPSKPAFHRFMMFGLVLTTALAVDDLFLVHEVVPDILVAFGWPSATAHRGEKLVYAAYALGALAYIGLFRDEAQKLGGLALLLLSGGFLAISVAVDGYFYHFFDWRHGGEVWLEDGAKLIGINSWLVAQLIMSRAMITKRS